jgi:hypothetical protein
MSDISPIKKLQNDWFRLHDLDRAQAVSDIRQSGISIRQIAAQLQLSESLLRRLLLSLQAPAADRALARQGKISTNELVRCARVAEIRHTSKYREALELERAKETRRGSDLICKWLLQTELNGPCCEMIVDEVRRNFHNMKQAGRHPSVVAPPDTPVTEIIERTKPSNLVDDGIDIIGWFVQWLCRWSFFAFPDEKIRDNALDLALQRQWGR